VAGSIAWRVWYTLVTPIRVVVDGLDSFLFWRRYARLKRGEAQPAGKLLPSAARELIARAETIEVLSLGGIAEGDLASFANCEVIGRTTVKDEGIRRLLGERLLIANEASGRGLLCIDGEYGVRVTAQGTTIDLMICFACGNVWVTGPAECAGMGNICRLPVGYILDAILRRAKIPLPKPGLSHGK
jgi:hypothetical protein